MKSSLIKPLREIYGSEETIIEKEYAHGEIDKEYLLNNKHKTRGSTRINRGLFDTNQEREEWRKKVLKTKMP